MQSYIKLEATDKSTTPKDKMYKIIISMFEEDS